MADRIRVTSLMRTSITAARVRGQRRGVSPQEVAGCRAKSKTHALELLSCGRLPVPLLASNALQGHDAILPCPAKCLHRTLTLLRKVLSDHRAVEAMEQLTDRPGGRHRTSIS